MTLREVFFAADGRLRTGWRALLFLPLFVAQVAVFVILMRVIFGEALREKEEALAALGGTFSALAAVLAAAILLRFLDRRNFRTMGFWPYRGWLGELGIGLAAGLGMVSLVVAFAWLADSVEFVALGGSGEVLLFGALWNSVVLLPAATAEELMFRGYPFQRLVEAWGAAPAVGLLSVLFGLLHLGNPSPTVLSSVNTALMGILLALAYLKTNGLWLPIGLHFSWNYALGFLYALPVSGFQLTHKLWQVETSGPAWLTGDAYGPEGSLLTTLVAVAGTVLLLRVPTRQASSQSRPAVE